MKLILLILLFSLNVFGETTALMDKLYFKSEVATQSTPTKGGKLYVKSDNKLYFLNDAALESDLTVDALLTSVEKSTTYTILTTDEVVLGDASGGDFTLTLPAVSGNNGLRYKIKNVGASGDVTIDGSSSETIDGSLTFVLSDTNQSVEIVCDGTEWFVISFQSTQLVSSGSGTKASWPITAAQWGDLTSITLTPGTWIIRATYVLYNNGTSGWTAGYGGVSTTTGNDSTGLVEAENLSIIAGNGTSTRQQTVTVATYIVSPTASDVYYFKGHIGSTISNLQFTYYMSALRIK